jgi:CDP-diacylglycerol--glycerol-3-phosphate 3-phosphatidyltransferase
MSGWVASIPNYLSYSRLVFTFAILYLLTNPAILDRYIAFALFLIASVTDFFDGFLARKYNVVSSKGKLLDPLTDKILVLAVLIMLIELDRVEMSVYTDQSYLPAWLVALIVIREIWVLGLRAIHALHDKALGAISSAKWKTVLQMLAIALLILGDFKVASVSGVNITLYDIGFNILLISLIFGIISSVNYTVEVLKQID